MAQSATTLGTELKTVGKIALISYCVYIYFFLMTTSLPSSVADPVQWKLRIARHKQNTQ